MRPDYTCCGSYTNLNASIELTVPQSRDQVTGSAETPGLTVTVRYGSWRIRRTAALAYLETLLHCFAGHWQATVNKIIRLSHRKSNLHKKDECQPIDQSSVTFKLSEPCVLYIGRAHRYPPNTPFYIFSTNIRTEFFKHAAHSPFFLFKMPFIS